MLFRVSRILNAGGQAIFRRYESRLFYSGFQRGKKKALSLFFNTSVRVHVFILWMSFRVINNLLSALSRELNKENIMDTDSD